MDKTININLGGTLFRIDEEAYRMLRDYLKSIDLKFRNTPGGSETIEDIESRIAEIFTSHNGLAGVITKEHVEAMISVLGKPEDFGQSDYEGAPYQAPYSQRQKMVRSSDDRIIGGVCGGIGAYLETEPVWFRILFVVFALMFGFGLFVYLALWVALPSASTGNEKKGTYDFKSGSSAFYGDSGNQTYTTASRAGDAVNEVFRAIGKVFYIIIRIFLIILGVSLVLTGFLFLLTFIMVFIFKFPGSFSTDAAGIHLSYLPDFLNYIVSPEMVPWIKTLIVLTVSIPLLAIIYGGIRLIFWFRARDGFLWLTGFILWVLSAAALSIILFDEGISYAETAKSTSQNYFTAVPDTIFVLSDRKLSDLNYDNEISIPDEEYNIYISDESKQLYLKTYLNISPSEDHSARLDVKKRSAGRSKSEAKDKAENLIYNFNITADTLFLDEYCMVPPGRKWSFDEVTLNLYAPEGTVIYMDKTIESQYLQRDVDDFVTDPKNRFWRMREYGLEYVESHPMRDN